MDKAKIYLDDHLKRFINTDELRPQTCKATYDNGYVVATNYHLLIVAPEKYFILKYEPVDKFPKYREIIPNVSEVLFTIDPLEILRIYDKMSKVWNYSPCKSCEGGGTIVCGACNYPHDCDDCNGTGHGAKIGKIVDWGKDAFSIADSYFNPEHLNAIAILANDLGEQISVYQCEGRKAMYAKIGDIEILAMPFIHDPISERKITPIPTTKPSDHE